MDNENTHQTQKTQGDQQMQMIRKIGTDLTNINLGNNPMVQVVRKRHQKNLSQQRTPNEIGNVFPNVIGNVTDEEEF